MSIINENDLTLMYSDIANFVNISDIQKMISKAETDVINYFEYIWFPQHYKLYFFGNTNNNMSSVNTGSFLPKFDINYFNTALIKNLLVYRTLGYYVFPSLMKTTDIAEDSFYSLAEYYKNKFKEELNDLNNAPLYDFNKDNQFNNLDLNSNMTGKPTITLVRS